MTSAFGHGFDTRHLHHETHDNIYLSIVVGYFSLQKFIYSKSAPVNWIFLQKFFRFTPYFFDIYILKFNQQIQLE